SEPRAASMRTSARVPMAARGSLPVVAAGGIMDGRGIRAALELGASAVQMGTAFVLCPESSANAAYREALKGPRAARTALTVTMSGRSARGLPNRMFFDAAAPGVPPLPDYPFVYDATKALQTAALARGNHDFAAQWAGQGAALARELPAAELLRTLVEELRG
ncbi:nitronate monooxygenase, partial [Pseudomonas aeruginosa]